MVLGALALMLSPGCGPRAVADAQENCVIMGGSIAVSPDRQSIAGFATCGRDGKLLPKMLQTQSTATGARALMPLGGPDPAMAGFWGDRWLFVVWAREIEGVNRLVLWQQDPKSNTGSVRHRVTVPKHLRLVHVIRGQGCALVRLFARGEGGSMPGQWFLARPDGLVEVPAGDASNTAYWLGGQRRFVITERGSQGVLRSVAAVDCDGNVSRPAELDISVGSFDIIKGALDRDVLVVGHNDNQPGDPPSKRALAAGATLIELHGVINQSFAVSDDGELFGISRGAEVTVYRSDDLRAVASVPSVDSDQHFLVLTKPPMIVFADERAVFHTKTFEVP